MVCIRILIAERGIEGIAAITRMHDPKLSAIAMDALINIMQSKKNRLEHAEKIGSLKIFDNVKNVKQVQTQVAKLARLIKSATQPSEENQNSPNAKQNL